MEAAQEVGGGHQQAEVWLLFAGTFSVGVFLLGKEVLVLYFFSYFVTWVLCLGSVLCRPLLLSGYPAVLFTTVTLWSISWIFSVFGKSCCPSKRSMMGQEAEQMGQGWSLQWLQDVSLIPDLSPDTAGVRYSQTVCGNSLVLPVWKV